MIETCPFVNCNPYDTKQLQYTREQFWQEAQAAFYDMHCQAEGAVTMHCNLLKCLANKNECLP